MSTGTQHVKAGHTLLKIQSKVAYFAYVGRRQNWEQPRTTDEPPQVPSNVDGKRVGALSLLGELCLPDLPGVPKRFALVISEVGS